MLKFERKNDRTIEVRRNIAKRTQIGQFYQTSPKRNLWAFLVFQDVYLCSFQLGLLKIKLDELNGAAR